MYAPACPETQDSSDDEKAEKTPLVRSSGVGHLNAIALAAIVWFNVSGGPVGSEQIIGFAGPVIGLISLVVATLLFSLPQALMTAELSTALPHNGGYSIWVQHAFGDFWALQESYYSWASGVVDNATYPLILYSSFQQLVTGTGLASSSLNSCQEASILNNQSGSNPSNLWTCMFASHNNCAPEYLLKLLIVLAFSVPTFFTNSGMGLKMSIAAVFVILPFVVMCGLGIPEMHPVDWLPLPDHVKWFHLANTAYWSVSGFDCCSTFAHEIERPRGTVLPRALWISLVFMLLCYLLPFAIGAAVDKDWRCWVDGSMTHVAQLIGGNWLGIWVLLSTLVSTWAQYAAELFEDSYQMLGMAESGLVPGMFKSRWSYTGAPINALVFQIVLICLLVGMDFQSILVIDNFFGACAVLLEFGALLQLRRTQPDLNRPFRIPLGTWTLALYLIPTFCIVVGIMCANIVSSTASLLICGGGLLIGPMLYIPLLIHPESTLSDYLGAIDKDDA